MESPLEIGARVFRHRLEACARQFAPVDYEVGHLRSCEPWGATDDARDGTTRKPPVSKDVANLQIMNSTVSLSGVTRAPELLPPFLLRTLTIGSETGHV